MRACVAKVCRIRASLHMMARSGCDVKHTRNQQLPNPLTSQSHSLFNNFIVFSIANSSLVRIDRRWSKH